ncbi:6-phosphogluconolactonase [Salinihabitans flavidus]|nr:6-phosphogluconolactonase [Salinihabitans flavidus]
MKLETYPDEEMLAIDLANTIAGELNSALMQDESARVLLAVPGGTSPGPVFDDLCAADLEWERIDVVLTDERWVPEDDPCSNTRLVKERLLTARAAAARFLPLYTAAHEPEEVLAELESMIGPELPIAVALMGMGPDMHVASLFPGMEGLEQALAPDAPILMAVREPSRQEARVTLTARVLNGALSKHLLISGDEKRAALERALKLPPEEAPVQAVLGGTTVHWTE